MKTLLAFTALAFMTMLGVTKQAAAQQLMIEDEVLFSKGSAPLQPLFLMLEPDPSQPFLCGFCPGLSGSFDRIPLTTKTEDKQPVGLVVTAILVDKDKRKIISDKPCMWKSSNKSILAISKLQKKNDRLYLLEPKKVGEAIVEISMGEESVRLGITVTREINEFNYVITKPGKDEQAGADQAATKPAGKPPVKDQRPATANSSAGRQ